MFKNPFVVLQSCCAKLNKKGDTESLLQIRLNLVLVVWNTACIEMFNLSSLRK